MNISREFYYRVKPNEKIESICEQFNTSNENIVRNNTNIALYAGEWIKIKVNDYTTHIVKPMDTLDSVATQNGITVDDIIKNNNLNTNKLYIGQSLKIYKK